MKITKSICTEHWNHRPPSSRSLSLCNLSPLYAANIHLSFIASRTGTLNISPFNMFDVMPLNWIQKKKLKHLRNTSLQEQQQQKNEKEYEKIKSLYLYHQFEFKAKKNRLRDTNMRKKLFITKITFVRLIGWYIKWCFFRKENQFTYYLHSKKWHANESVSCRRELELESGK